MTGHDHTAVRIDTAEPYPAREYARRVFPAAHGHQEPGVGRTAGDDPVVGRAGDPLPGSEAGPAPGRTADPAPGPAGIPRVA
ncbi:hypothetical protein [Streptomyces sp. NBC_01794]|uniref:hypothetical protein n=1 Tax=Streptomyces sp. NBC_01794 TaxID=2975942 RepID=UPI003089BE39|nr:hypothetical protein OIE54_06765 [Streptomyces sp. NBC_01794]